MSEPQESLCIRSCVCHMGQCRHCLELNDLLTEEWSWSGKGPSPLPQGDRMMDPSLPSLVLLESPWLVTWSSPRVIFLAKDEKDKNGPKLHLHFSAPTGGLSGATIIDSLDTLYLMELKEEFQEAKAWVQDSFHLNVVSQRPRGDEGLGESVAMGGWAASSSTDSTLLAYIIEQA